MTLRLLTIFMLLCFLVCGCEDGDSGGHDFGDNDPNLYVALGDSLTEGPGLSDPYPEKLSRMLGSTVINEGKGGELSTGGKDRVHDVLAKYKPGYLLVLYGANDVIFGLGTNYTKEKLRAIIQAAKENRTKVVLATLPPVTGPHTYMESRIAALNPEIRRLAAEEGTKLADMEEAFGDDTSYLSADGLHMNDSGARLMAETFFNALE